MGAWVTPATGSGRVFQPTAVVCDTAIAQPRKTDKQTAVALGSVLVSLFKILSP